MTQAQSKFRMQVVVAFALVYVLWGSTYLGIRLAVDHLPPLVMGGLRFTISGLLMLVWCRWQKRPILVTRGELLRLTIIGFLLLVTGNVVLGWAETKIPTTLAALLIAITPLWFLLLESLSSRGDHISVRGVAGIALGVVGVGVLLWPDFRHLSLAQDSLLGAPLVLASSFSWASGSILSKRWQMNIDPYTSSGWQMLMAGIVNSAGALAIGDLHRTVWARSSLLAVLYLIIAGSIIGFTAYIWLLRNVPTPKVATYAYVNPIVAVFLGWLVLNEKLNSYMIAGAVIIIISVILVTGAKLKPREGRTVAEEELGPLESAGD